MTHKLIAANTDNQYPIVPATRQTLSSASPLDENERLQLALHEATIRAGLETFIAVGIALYEIMHRRLYRETHQRFEDYCEATYALSRSTAYQKVKAARAYQSVSAIADKSEVNEYQMRQLAMLKNPKDRLKAWKQVKAEQHNTGQAITAARIRQIVTAQQRKGKGTTFASLVIADETFTAIPWRWDLVSLEKDPVSQEMRKELVAIPEITPQPNNANQSPPQWVMVNPDSDLAEMELSESDKRQLVTAMATDPHHCFILWTRSLDWIKELPALPPNVELIVQVSTSAELQLVLTNTSRLQQDREVAGVWMLPSEDLSWSSALPFTRLLIGGPEYAMPPLTREGGEIFRRLLIQALAEPASIHLAKGVRAQLAQPSAGITKKLPKVEIRHKAE